MPIGRVEQLLQCLVIYGLTIPNKVLPAFISNQYKAAFFRLLRLCGNRIVIFLYRLPADSLANWEYRFFGLTPTAQPVKLYHQIRFWSVLVR